VNASRDDAGVIGDRPGLRVRLALGLIVLAVFVVACEGDSSVARSGKSGIRGMVTAGPTCPVERPDQPCPPAPIAAPVVARTLGGRRIASGRSAPRDGRFRIVLSPGRYVVTAETDGHPRCPAVTVTVPFGHFAKADVACDSGIR
jgi:hypothetical protein